MWLIVPWCKTPEGGSLFFGTPEQAWSFLCGVDYAAPSLSDRHYSHWYPDDQGQGGFTWQFAGNSEKERQLFLTFWERHSLYASAPREETTG